jgi:hypothetical protein
VGRIETAGQTLVDLDETMELLGKSRATVFRMLNIGILIRVPVIRTRTLYITLDSIERSKNPTSNLMPYPSDTYYPVETEQQKEDMKREINRWFGRVLKRRPNPPQLSLPFPDQPL